MGGRASQTLEADGDNARALTRELVNVEPDADEDPDGPDPHVPAVAWDAGAPFAAAHGGSARASGEAMIRDALVLPYLYASR